MVPRGDYKNHVKTFHNDNHCDQCNETFDRPWKLKSHKFRKHAEAVYNSQPPKVKFTCELCGKIICKAALSRHMR